jgi:hypothetical protein
MDERKSVRRLVEESRRPCEIIIGAMRLSALLLDESDGGFGIAVLQTPKLRLAVKRIVKLGTYDGWFRARIAHFREVEATEDNLVIVPPDEADDAAVGSVRPVVPPKQATVAKEKQRWYRIGLIRLGRIEPPADGSAIGSLRRLLGLFSGRLRRS